MIYYVIKRDDGLYYNSQQLWGLRFVDEISDASFYEKKCGAESTLDWIVINEYRYKIRKEQLKVVKVEIKEINAEELDKQIAALQHKGVKINDIVVGEQFVYCGHTYTKLNKENFCIIDDYDSDFMGCQFDSISNNYDESLIRYYINSDRFIEKLGVNKADIKSHYKDDLITLLSREEYEKYRDLIKDYDTWWGTRSADPNTAYFFCYISSSGYIYSNLVTFISGVRLGFNLDPNTPVDRLACDYPVSVEGDELSELCKDTQ